MAVELRLPNINGTEREQLAQIRSYLYQLIPQLQMAMNTVEPAKAEGGTKQQIVMPSTSKPFDAVAAFTELKPLIIKSSEIVEAYYEDINKKLSGIYVADSDFGTFVQETSQVIKENSTNVNKAFENIQSINIDLDNITDEFNKWLGKIANDVDQVRNAVIESNAHIKSGLLDDKAIPPIYGIEVGQRNVVNGVEVFNKYARFTADRLSFYDKNGEEVAYISDYKLYIRDLHVTSSIIMGGFEESVMTNGDIVTKWVGGE